MNHTYTERAIREAVEKGWEFGTWRTNKKQYMFNDTKGVFADPNFQIDWIRFEASEDAQQGRFIERVDISVADLFLDPLFWSALGRARGWTGLYTDAYDGDDGKRHINDMSPRWLFYWHRFIDHLADGNSPESYFAEMYKGV